MRKEHDIWGEKHKWELFKEKLKVKQYDDGCVKVISFNAKDGKGEFRNLSQRNIDIIVQYLLDMETGMNSGGGKKGGRSYGRLNSLKIRIPQMARWFNEFYKKDIIDVNRRDVLDLFDKLNSGKILNQFEKKYKSVDDFEKDFESFFHWYMKSMKRLYNESKGKKGEILEDITDEIETHKTKPQFNYLTMEDVQKLIDAAKFDYKVMILFMYDAGCRSPSELFGIRVKECEPYPSMKDVYILTIRDEISKTFGRKIKLMLCGRLLNRYIEIYKLKSDDFLFKGHPSVINQYLKRLGHKVLKIGKMEKGKNGDDLITNGLTMYDFRHCSACYWLQRYKNQNTMMYRFGWRKAEMVYYYSEFLGLKDDITPEDLDTAEVSSQMQKQIDGKDKQLALQDEKLNSMQKQIDDMNRIIQRAILEKVRKKKGV